MSNRVWIVVLVCLLAAACGSGGGEGNNNESNSIDSGGGSFEIRSADCRFGDGTSIVINASDGSDVNFCTEQGGTVSETVDSNNPDEHPNDQSGQTNTTTTTNNNAPAGSQADTALKLRGLR